MRNAFIETLCRMAKENPDIFLLAGDLGYHVLDCFWEQFPERFVNAGISEQNMTAVAAGMAMEGKCCFTYSIGNFATLRCLEQIRNDAAYHNANVNIVAVGGGLSYGAMGVTHHATEDLAAIRAIPGMSVFVPCDPSEAAAATELAAAMEGPCYIRLERGNDRILQHSTTGFQVGTANCLREGRDAVVFAVGTIAGEALDAADILSRSGISCEVWSVFTVKPLDEAAVRNAAARFSHIFSVEEHNVLGGMGSAIAEILSGCRHTAVLHRMGLPDEFARVVGSQGYLRGIYGISAERVAERISTVLTADVRTGE